MLICRSLDDNTFVTMLDDLYSEYGSRCVRISNVEGSSRQKISRILSLYEKLNNGVIVDKQFEANRFQVSPKSIQRDIEDIREFLAEYYLGDEGSYVEYSPKKKGYIRNRMQKKGLSNDEILAITKVLLESRAFPKDEMDMLLDKLIYNADTENMKQLEEFISNERFHYMPLKHETLIIKRLWQFCVAIREQRIVGIEYLRVGEEKTVSRNVKPQGIVFSEYYFYLVAYIDDHDYDFPAIYRLDRINKWEVLDRRFPIKYTDRFQEGEFRKRVQFMKAGKILKFRFRFWGPSIEAVLDRLPMARIIEFREDKYLVEAEVYGPGVIMWLLSQGQFLEVVGPEEFRAEISDTVHRMAEQYNKKNGSCGRAPYF